MTCKRDPVTNRMRWDPPVMMPCKGKKIPWYISEFVKVNTKIKVVQAVEITFMHFWLKKSWFFFYIQQNQEQDAKHHVIKLIREQRALPDRQVIHFSNCANNIVNFRSFTNNFKELCSELFWFQLGVQIPVKWRTHSVQTPTCSRPQRWYCTSVMPVSVWMEHRLSPALAQDSGVRRVPAVCPIVEVRIPRFSYTPRCIFTVSQNQILSNLEYVKDLNCTNPIN